ncbi:hypothetical protein AB9L17_02140 [Bacillus sp. RS11]|uniref:hypothetical protein n=1 Tax=Lysinibacillus sphaericus TaxID=1421 RepID=UPI001CBF172C|nr:hypothetical protein [Lysinibacillus sphaericus]
MCGFFSVTPAEIGELSLRTPRPAIQNPDALLICAKAKRQLPLFSVAKAKRQLQLRRGETDYYICSFSNRKVFFDGPIK